MPLTIRLDLACAAAFVSLGLAGCGGSTTSPEAAPSATAAATSVETSATAANEDSETAEPPAGTKVSANSASEDEIAAALEGAGVDNADRWTEEVVEYRPYPPDDPNLTKLRDELAKYNPARRRPIRSFLRSPHDRAA